MKKTDLLIVGGSAAGLVVAMTARKHYPQSKILIIREDKEGQLMVPCGIPYIFGTLGATKKNVVPDATLSQNNIDLLVDKVSDIDRNSKIVTTSNGESLKYDKLALATGSIPISIPIPGINLENVFFAKKDMDYLDEMLKVFGAVKDIAIIGGGFIGLEFADEFKKNNANVTLVEVLPHCLQLVFDEDYCLLADSKLEENGINVRTNAQAEAILGKDKVEGLQLAGGEIIKVDMVFLGVGVRPNTELAQKADLRMGETRGIWTDEYGRTSDKDIFAAGDCAEKRSFFTNEPSPLKLASIATQDARIVGANLFGLKRRNGGVIGSFSTVIGDMFLGQAGLTEKAAKEAGFDYIVGEVVTFDKHPGTLPGSKEMRIKLLFEAASNEILGGQVCGGVTVGEITNIVSLLIQKRMRADEIVTLQSGTHPFSTPSPVSYPIINAAEAAVVQKN